KSGGEYHVVTDGAGGKLSGLMDRFRRGVDGASLFQGVGGSVYPVTDASGENDLQFQFFMPVAGESAVRKGVKLIDKFGEREHPVGMGQGFHGGVIDGFSFHNRISFPVICNDSDRKSTRLNSSHVSISYAVFCLKKKI